MMQPNRHLPAHENQHVDSATEFTRSLQELSKVVVAILDLFDRRCEPYYPNPNSLFHRSAVVQLGEQRCNLLEYRPAESDERTAVLLDVHVFDARIRYLFIYNPNELNLTDYLTKTIGSETNGSFAVKTHNGGVVEACRNGEACSSNSLITLAHDYYQSLSRKSSSFARGDILADLQFPGS